SFRAENEREFLESLSKAGILLYGDIASRYRNGAYLVKKWESRGVIETLSRTVIRDPAGKPLFPSPRPSHLFGQQERVLDVLLDRIRRGGFYACLLHGVTGSGKTEVYLRAVEQALSLGRQAVLMVPEIALAVYMEGMFRDRLGDRVAVYHSGLGRGERYDQWRRIARGEADVVIGARSALFAPCPRLGLIVVDEEHDIAYKQEESPRYQARDAAVVRAKIEKATVILGSGTPSVQSFHNARTGRYHLLAMPDRIEERPPPRIEIQDMREANAVEDRGVIGPVLREALERNLAEGRQAILFLNRRGFNRLYLCPSCGEVLRCANCDVALTYHLGEDRLVCHYCGFSLSPLRQCPSCGGKGMRAYGFGTERLEKEIEELYPEISVERMDRDSTRRKGQTYGILKRFGDRDVDVLVGTQMITKGYDFPNVTLVGVIAADFSLAFPDFRAGERTFQILSQVAGRAGRGDRRGRVIIQTFNPEHYAITTARDHDYPSFFEKERTLREQLRYPPFSYLACLKLQGNSRQKTEEMSSLLGRGMHGILKKWPKRGKEIRVLGPTEAPLQKLKGKYRMQILVKSGSSALLHVFLREVEAEARRMLRSTGVSLALDVDPYQML
ncbi:MAG: primosomal protein N', partial [Deltaproteobacteria bacterium]|nr:primosomal protein N' [Deltaproteobacteria bacterium]